MNPHFRAVFRFKRALLLFLLPAILWCLVALMPALAASAPTSDNVGATAEWLPARRVLMHTPGEEIFLGVIHPAAALYEKPFDLTDAIAEHRRYIERLEDRGATVHTVVDTLLSGTLDDDSNPLPGPDLDRLRAFAAPFLKIDATALPPDRQAEQATYKQQVIQDIHPRELVRIILMQPTIHLHPTDGNTGLSATYESSPVMNLYFCRDQMITTAKGVVLSKMASDQRAVETRIMKFVLSKLGIEPVYEVTGDGRLEGGDYFSAGERAFIGQGLRTNADGIRQLLDHQVFGLPEVVVVKDSWEDQEEMHLDTYFNIIGPQLAVLVDLRMHPPGQGTDDITTLVDVYRLEDGEYRLKIQDRDFLAYLQGDLGYTVIPVTRKDQNRYAINFLTTEPYQILAIEGASDPYKHALADNGVYAVWMDFGALTSGYGAAHCTTQVLYREPVVESRQTTDTLLMVSPDDFAYNPQTAVTNAFQKDEVETATPRAAALREFSRMVNTLSTEGIDVIRIPSREDVVTPDAVFPNNWFSTHRNRDGGHALVIYPMLTPNRRAEIRVPFLKKTLQNNGFPITRVVDLTHYETDNRALEGTGSMVLDRIHRVVFAALSPRTDEGILADFCRQLDYRAVVFNSHDAGGKQIYHTNVMMSIGDGFAVICTEAITDPAQRTMVLDELTRLGKEIIPITFDQMGQMCGNILEVRSRDRHNLIVMSKRSFDHFTPEQRQILRKYGKLVPVDIQTIEDIGGGSARCMMAEIF